MFPGLNVDTAQKGVGLYVDILDTIASLLLRNDVVGKVSDTGEWEWNFKWEWEEKLNSSGEVTIGDCSTSESFRLAQEEVRRMYPDLVVYLLYIIICTDKTQLCKFGKQTYCHLHILYMYLRFFIIDIRLYEHTFFCTTHTFSTRTPTD